MLHLLSRSTLHSASWASSQTKRFWVQGRVISLAHEQAFSRLALWHLPSARLVRRHLELQAENGVQPLYRCHRTSQAWAAHKPKCAGAHQVQGKAQRFGSRLAAVLQVVQEWTSRQHECCH